MLRGYVCCCNRYPCCLEIITDKKSSTGIASGSDHVENVIIVSDPVNVENLFTSIMLVRTFLSKILLG